MNCALTQNYIMECGDAIGGLKRMLSIEHANVLGITVTDGVITAITIAPGKKFFQYQLVRETAGFKETPTKNVQNGSMYYTQELTIVLNKLRTNTRNEILNLAQNTLIQIVEDRMGQYWLLGKDTGMELTGGEVGSGTANGDRNGYSLVFTGQERVLAYEVSPTIIDTLLSATPVGKING
ncbi:hypothetical protein KTO58_01260 [Chitinophaga pendula]|uniref:hypothetical protein n=1 Tax=Chitinophaga TaxID=79328 RepID=UPI000BAFDA95|nr:MULTISPECIES: hypothetical protein [Chitinophaga]ASZ14509.1 hypothetical protein CK934_27960 [Chitinophaga sp. MD30]UCJ07834.1 hypothetical protein KTO58_01260 [Chitinophaga pendula]